MYGAVAISDKACQAGGHQAHHRLRGLRRPKGPDPVPTRTTSIDTTYPPPGPAVPERAGLPAISPTSSAWRSLEGFYIKPRIDLDLLREHSGGLIACSACLAGEVPKLLAAGDYDKAKEVALEMRELFGADGYYLELPGPRHPGPAPGERGLIRLHEETGIPLVATNDAHYLRKEDAEMQDILMCIQMGKTVDDPNRMKFETEEFYVKTEAEMAALFPNYPEALENTVKIAQLCNVEFEFGKYHLPHFQLPEGWTDGDAYFKKLCMDGFRWRYPSQPQEYLDKLRYEMDMIRKMGFVDYFLIVSDFIAYAKGHGIPVGPGRGLGGGVHGVLLPEHHRPGPREVQPVLRALPEPGAGHHARYRHRLLHPPPAGGHRLRGPEVRADHVAQIVTFGTMAARAAVRDVGRVLNMPYADVDAIAKQIPSGPGALHITLEDALKLSKQLKESYDGSPQVKKLIDTARAIEGMPRNTSTTRRRGGHHQPAGERLCPPGQKRRPGSHAVHHDHPGGAGPAEDGLPGPAEPDGAGRRGPAGPAQPPGLPHQPDPGG